jgi:hypothetical protein
MASMHEAVQYRRCIAISILLSRPRPTLRLGRLRGVQGLLRHMISHVSPHGSTSWPVSVVQKRGSPPRIPKHGLR